MSFDSIRKSWNKCVKLECLTWNQINPNMVLMTESWTEPGPHWYLKIWTVKNEKKKKKEMMVVWVRKIGISVLLNGLNIAFWGRKAQPADFSCSSPSSRVKQFYKNTGWYTWGGSSCFSGIPSGEEGSPAIQMGSGKGRRRGEKAGMGKRAWDLVWHLLSILFSALATLFFRTP